MKRERNQRPPRKMKPVFLVFCEGDTEEAMDAITSDADKIQSRG